MLKKSSEHIRNSLDLSLRTVGDMALKRRAKTVIEGLDLQEGDRILEVGCGNGYYLSLLNRLGLKLDLTGIDNDNLALKDAAKFIGDKKVKLILSDGAKLPFSANSFDKIVMSEVIEHVSDEKAVLKEALRVLRKGGILTLTTCNINYPFLWDPLNWILQHVLGTHIKRGFWAGIWNQHDRMYKKERILNLVKEAGFNISETEILTSWCLPFNHYLVNLVAKLFYAGKLPKGLSEGINKFKNNKQPLLIMQGFKLINLFDHLNDRFPKKEGVSIFIKAKK
ncbi:hypothetical protein A3B45_00420 [Candidatus Daviesbacteria bacterium RIFCSPLOWO2_01_FULL_39_12]|uniref:Methyltransferase type 11 domain-containing protein n=1 Tax=Candidatus Daviesbacteria bacterium RIFCSPLOWO2_01_FULL_39_12 TaxID=1797785 RepID=A0A1F5KNZ0_9BACT|nr:MAG: hypothetical protein A3B45_00420 [Candidatus Daviesbacteria bacterium RIFCSPLOWO2_01_FULL_39_12]